jgi:hypothetical protein
LAKLLFAEAIARDEIALMKKLPRSCHAPSSVGDRQDYPCVKNSKACRPPLAFHSKDLGGTEWARGQKSIGPTGVA